MKGLPPNFSCIEETLTVPVNEYWQRAANFFHSTQTYWVRAFSNRGHLTGFADWLSFDPGFEQAHLTSGSGGKTRNAVESTSPDEMKRTHFFLSGGQKRRIVPQFPEPLSKISLKPGLCVCLLGWNYLESFKTGVSHSPEFAPSFFVEETRKLVGLNGPFVDGTSLTKRSERSFRANNAADQLAFFETSAKNCSAAVFIIIRVVSLDMSEDEAIYPVNYDHAAQTLQPIFASGNQANHRLHSLTQKKIAVGNGVGSVINRQVSLMNWAGMMLSEMAPVVPEAWVCPCLRGIMAWSQLIYIRPAGGEICQKVANAFEDSELHSELYPDFLSSFDQQVHSLMRTGRKDLYQSGIDFPADSVKTPLPPDYSFCCVETIDIAVRLCIFICDRSFSSYESKYRNDAAIW